MKPSLWRKSPSNGISCSERRPARPPSCAAPLRPHASASKCFAKQNLALAEFTSAKEGYIRGPHETPFHGEGDIIEAFTMEEIPQ